MSIPESRYVDITSSVGAGAVVDTRSLIARLFSTNLLIPTNETLYFDNADDVATYFGSASDEYARAAFYFGWISKQGVSVNQICYSRWNEVDVAPEILGAPGAQALATWTAITNGGFNLNIGGTSRAVSGINFSGAANLAAVAALIQTAVRAITAGGAMYTAATVSWDATRQSFNFVGGVTGANTIAVTAGTGGTDIAGQLGWLSTLAIFSDGAVAQTITDLLSDSTNSNNNFGSFAFIDELTQDEIVEAATWNDTQNNMFMYSVRCTSSTAAALSAALVGLSGVTVTLSPIATEYPEQVPMMLMAGTDYTAINSTKNYMFQIFTLTPSVLTSADADLYDGLRINYYGQTQTAGQQIQFYQRGLMMGLPTDAVYQNVYANEVWLKDAMGAAFMTLLLALDKVSFNSTGRAQCLAAGQSIIDTGVLNGVISVGKTLTAIQRLYVTNVTGDPKAWQQVQNIGYWFDVFMVREIEDNVPVYIAKYTLVYSKDDVINKVEGRHILI